MSIFKTTFSVESTDTFTPTEFTTTYNGNLLDDIVMGKVTVGTNPTEIPLGSGKSRGSFLYVKSIETNPKQNIIGIVSFGGAITLSPGEFAAIPIYTFGVENGPFGSNSLVAFTTNGTAELEYFIGSRGEDVGETVLIRFKDPTGTWKYFTLDANTAIPGQGINIFMNNSAIDTQVDHGDYPFSTVESIVNRKGYIIRFHDGQGANKLVFINSRGSIIDTENFDGQEYIKYRGEGRANLIISYDGADGHAIYFDGDNYWQHDFVDINNIYVDDNRDDCAADGTFPVYIEGYDGGSNEALFLIKGADKTLIKTTNPSSNWSNSYVYSYGNFIAVETITEGNEYDELITLEIFNTDGALLKTVDFDNTEMINRDYYFYGSGKMQVVYTDATSGDFIFLNYNQLTGKLIGEDLTWNSNRNAYDVVCSNYNTGYARDHKPESVAIILHGNDSINNSYLLNVDTDGVLEVTYIINNDLEPRNYVVPNSEKSYYVRNHENTFNQATDKDFVLLSGNDRTGGPLVATRFTSGAEPTRFNLINDLITYDVSNSNVDVDCFGDYRLLDIRTATGNTNREYIVYDSNVLDKISIDSNSDDYSYEFNTLIVIDYDLENEWYFNTSTKKWVLLPTYTDGNYWSNSSEGDQHPVSPGKIAFIRDQYTRGLVTLHGRMITRGSAGNERELLKLENIYDWELNMSTETVVLPYKETQNSNWKVRVFNHNLVFLYEVDTEKPNRETNSRYGKLNYWSFSDNDDNYTHYKFGRLLSSSALTQNQPNGYTDAFNNSDWISNHAD
jgi:hypothetical protein